MWLRDTSVLSGCFVVDEVMRAASHKLSHVNLKTEKKTIFIKEKEQIVLRQKHDFSLIIREDIQQFSDYRYLWFLSSTADKIN